MSGNFLESHRLFTNMAGTSKTFNKTTSYLKKIIGHRIGKIFSLNSGEIEIGRNRQSAHICIQDPNVSRSHCVLKRSEKGWFIKDLESVNGTFLDGKMLEPQILYPLKDGAGIYLGPPEDAPAAFIFLTKLPKERSCETNMKSCSQKNGGNTHAPVLVSSKSNKSIKRPSDSEASQKKKKTTSHSLSPAVQGSDFLSDSEDDDNLSNCSITSYDSLRTRVRKMSAKKINAKKDTTSAASTSASPKLKPSNDVSLESKPSTSANPEILDIKKSKPQKPDTYKEFAILNALFSESQNSNSGTIKEENSQSILNDRKILVDCDPFPSSQRLPEKAVQKEVKEYKNNVKFAEEDSLEEQLRKAVLESKKLKRDKLYLFRLVKELKSEEFLKKKVQVEFRKLLEDELMCNICTEVFIKAVTLGCSHTFCEYCISEWKKKQKKCPICREKITAETKILILDSFINKTVEQLDVETQNRRKELIATREKAKAAKQKKNKRSRGHQIRSDSSEADEIGQLHGEASNSIGVQIRFSRNSSPSIQLLQEDELNEMTSDLSYLSDGSDMSVDGYGYFGGYGRCFNCGRRGHWANGCPY